MFVNISRNSAYSQVGEGWKSLIDKFYDVVESDKTIYVNTVKEKFGGLRIYFGHDCFNPVENQFMPNPICYHNQEHIWELADSLMEQSYKICEACGNPGELRSKRHWIKTMCDSCEKAGL
jgi:hypothetical protein